MDIKAVVFDMDGVIFDTEHLIIETWKPIEKKYNLKDIEKNCLKCTGVNSEATKQWFLDYYGQDFPYDKYKAEARALFFQTFGDGKKYIKKGVKELLAFLKEEGYKIALASSTREEFVRKELSSADLIHYFDELICGDMVQRSKPHPDIFLKACETLNIAPQYALGIEDSLNGVKAAHSAGMHIIMVPDLVAPTPEIEEIADAILDDLLVVKDYIKNEMTL